MKLLAVETSTEACSAALSIDGCIHEQFALAPREHTKLILPMIDALLAEAQVKPQQLDAVAFSRGPGSFTGVRIATGVIQGIAFATDLPVVPVSTLAAIAQQAIQEQNTDCVFVAMDARMEEIFWGVYEQTASGFVALVGEESVTPAETILLPTRKGFGVGSGWGVYESVLTARLGSLLSGIKVDYLPRASAIAQLGVWGFNNQQAVPVEQALPVYLRDKVAQKESER